MAEKEKDRELLQHTVNYWKKTPKHALNGQKRDKISYNVISMVRREKEKVLFYRAHNGWKKKRKRAPTTFCMWLEIKKEKNPTTCSHWLQNKTKRVTKTRCQWKRKRILRRAVNGWKIKIKRAATTSSVMADKEKEKELLQPAVIGRKNSPKTCCE